MFPPPPHTFTNNNTTITIHKLYNNNNNKTNTTGAGTRGSMSGGRNTGPGGSQQRKSKTALNRRAIRASAFVVDEPGEGDPTKPGYKAYVPPVIPKSDVAKQLIYNAIRNNVLFKACSSEELKDLIDAFSTKTREKNSIVIQEGAQGDGFYVLSNGSVNVYEATEFKGTLHPGMGFGEIALLYSCPRTATVRAREECDLWFIDRRAFRAIMARHKRKRLNMKLMLLEKVRQSILFACIYCLRGGEIIMLVCGCGGEGLMEI